MYQDGQVKD